MVQQNSLGLCIYGTRVWPRTYSFLSKKPQRAMEAILAWDSLPTDDDTFFFDMLEVHTDGSAVLRKGRPSVPISAGWGALFFLL